MAGLSGCSVEFSLHGPNGSSQSTGESSGSASTSGRGECSLTDSITVSMPGQPKEFDDSIGLGDGRQVSRVRWAYPDSDPDYVVQLPKSSGLPDDQNPVKKHAGDQLDEFPSSYAAGIAEVSDGVIKSSASGGLKRHAAVDYVVTMPDGRGARCEPHGRRRRRRHADHDCRRAQLAETRRPVQGVEVGLEARAGLGRAALPTQ